MPGTASPKPASSAALRAMLWPVAPSGQAAADDDVLDLGRIDAGALHRMAQHVRRQRNAVGLVERAARGARDAGPAVGDDGDVLHGELLDGVEPIVRGATLTPVSS